MVHAMVEIPHKQWLTLCEAGTWMVYGEALDKEQFARQGRPSWRMFHEPWLEALRRCGDEAPPDGPFADFLRAHCRNPFNANDIVAVKVTAEELAAVRGHWPKSGDNLHNITAICEAARRIEEDRENAALNEIRHAAIGGEINLRGRRDNGAGPSRDYSPIDAAHLDDRHVLNWMLSDLTLRRSCPMEGEPGAYWTGPVRPVDDFYYDDVIVERATFAKWVKSRPTSDLNHSK